METIDPYLFENYFKLFKSFVEKKSGSSFISFPSNYYTDEQEGYKDKIYEKARQKLKYQEWKDGDLGSGNILRSTISAVKLENNYNNLVDWRLVSKFEEKLNDKEKLKVYEETLSNFYHNNVTDESSFEELISCFGKNYPLLAYLYFIKDKAQYMPISPTNFDVAFAKLGVEGFRTSHQCSWENYSQYNQLLNQARELLINEGIKDVSLLNAHSFVWMIDKQLKEIEVSDKDTATNIITYNELASKDKETVVKARIGQGLFRSYLINYWGKCSVTGCDKLDTLIASHIKPWKDCDNREAIDVYNGFLLSPNLDKLFDLGLITFEDNGNIIISSKLTKDNIASLGILSEMKVTKIEENHKQFLKFHREIVFKP